MGVFVGYVGRRFVHLVNDTQVCQGIDCAIYCLPTLRTYIRRQTYRSKFVESIATVEMVLINTAHLGGIYLEFKVQSAEFKYLLLFRTSPT